MNIRIDYYTGTGGSKLVAERLSGRLGEAGCRVSVNRIVRDKFTPLADDTDYYVLLFAVHSFNAPRPAMEWAQKLEGKQKRCAVVSVSGAGEVVSNTACRREIIKKLESRGFSVDYEDMVQMPNNWVSVPGEEKCTGILRRLPGKVQEITDTVLTGKRVRKTPFPIDRFISFIGKAETCVTRKFGRRIRTSHSCTGCGLCAAQCCSSNITIENKKAVFGSRCDMCLGCIYSCPHHALTATYAGFQVDKKGYDLRKMEKKISAGDTRPQPAGPK